MLQYTSDKLISSQGNFDPSACFSTEGVSYRPLSRLAPYVVNKFYPLIYVFMDCIDYFALLLGATRRGAMNYMTATSKAL